MGVAVCAALVLGGCGGTQPTHHGEGSAGHAGHAGSPAPNGGHGGGVAGSAGRDAGCSSASDGSSTKKTAGEACSCAGDCASGFCADGVCCNQACTGSCMTCAQNGSEGTCLPRTNGTDPRQASACPVSPQNSCGLDGKCDGAGKCRDYLPGIVCKAGSCQDAAVVGLGLCDGAGACRPGPTTICAPYLCNPDTNTCYEQCSSKSQCASDHGCDSTGSCGKRMLGATCAKNDDCLSSFCADGVCCNTACTGACVSCNLPSNPGVCWPLDAGLPDLHKVCLGGTYPCGQTGLCDGVGGCALAAVGSVCVAPSCTGNQLNTAATCDGLGSCRPAGLQPCSPFICSAGACTGTCNTDADCDTGISCVNHSCGPKQNGQPCTQGSECKSNQCVDTVCCESACTGGCRSCDLPGSLGKCAMIPAGGADMRGTCHDTGVASCGANGKCDGSGGCQLYAKGNVCKGESCTSNVYTPPSTCDGAGRCLTPDTLACSPYTCNGSKCFSACTADNQCISPNSCQSNSCGKASNGAACSSADHCKSGICSQGVCCNSACSGACQSCALSGTLGTCTNVATGSADPSGMCKDQGASSCGTNGKCQAGACQKYASGTKCAGAACPGGSVTFTGTSTCDGAGTCVKPASTSCFPYVCGSSACKSACTSNADCDPPNTCAKGSCGLKGNGQTCGGASDCKSGFCSQGVCCSTNCNGTCKSCNASPSTAGTCTNVGAGQSDPQSGCTDQGTGSCGNDGKCNGSGACEKYAAGTVCVASKCPAGTSTQTNARTCDGKGTCQAATTTNCGTFLCNGSTACNTSCTSNQDCLSPNVCNTSTNQCGLHHQGQSCSASDDCASGLTCVDGVCCASPSCGTCQACNIQGSAGTCANVPTGSADPHGGCVANGTCGNTGTCDGTGKCAQQPATVSCGTAGCASKTAYNPLSHCDGAGNCAMVASIPCMPYVCAMDACETSCTSDDDCQSPDTCQPGVGGTKSCSLKANGLPCTTGDQCNSGACADSVCCGGLSPGSTSCGKQCQSCNASAALAGTCQNLPAGASAPSGQCAASSSNPCGNTGKCDGAGNCSKAAAGGSCGNGPTCAASGFTPGQQCDGMGNCPAAAAMSCLGYGCALPGGCYASCTGNGQCAAGNVCIGGVCMSGGKIGDSCSDSTTCAKGTCVDGVCCGSASCGRCQTCNGTKPGTCTAVAAGVAEPHNMCAPTTNACGNTGACAGDQTCAQVAGGTTCGDGPACSGGIQTSGRTCDGNGTCSPATSKACTPFACGATACKVACASDMDCINGDYCDTSGNCKTKKSPGDTCGSTVECAIGVCGAQGVCCDTACSGTCVTCTLPTSPGTCMPSTDPSCLVPPPPSDAGAQ